MNLGIISLIALLLAITIGFLRNANVGVLCLGFAMILGLWFGIPTGKLLAGFSSSIFMQMVGITYLFGIVKVNGTLELLAKKLLGLVGKQVHLIPVVFFIIGAILSGIGPGSIPCLAIIPVIAIPVAVSAGLNPIMVAIIGDFGVMSARTSPLTPESAVVSELMIKQGLPGNTLPLMFSLMFTSIIMALLVFVYYHGWEIEERKVEVDESADVPKMNFTNVLSVLALAVLAIGVLFLKWNAGFTGFTCGTILICLGCGDEKAAMRSIPWGVIFMIIGVGVLMHIVTISGGIDLLIEAMKGIMTTRTAATITGALAGIMSLFSSGLGVVFPTLIPTAGGLAQSMGANAIELCAAIVIGGTIAGFTPMSVTGALIMAGAAQQENAETRFPQNRLFIELFAVSFIGLAVLGVLAYAGLYGITINIGA
ncbi:MAG: hypothetical protein IJU48_03535 [Synergistaceae bacterium]|nr:hypothetical protein [Synergistaceae bacterium]